MLELIISIFNIIFGLFMALVGLKILKPYSEEKAKKQEKYFTFYTIAGIGLLLWGLMKTL